jgi:hypothetical protein
VALRVSRPPARPPAHGTARPHGDGGAPRRGIPAYTPALPSRPPRARASTKGHDMPAREAAHPRVVTTRHAITPARARTSEIGRSRVRSRTHACASPPYPDDSPR